ncbi:hypothetical protein [Streptomyces sp. NPDC090994]|uniref:hypothetical protein n=1 Tax=Streptomyces sp. NPDC090994 TaxID=3365969 RepID=UPI00382D0355
MALKKALACTLTALAMAGGAASTAVAADDDSAKFGNDTQILSCDTIEVIKIPILASANNNLDCSDNNKEEEETKVHIVDDRDNAALTNFLLKKHGK